MAGRRYVVYDNQVYVRRDAWPTLVQALQVLLTPAEPTVINEARIGFCKVVLRRQLDHRGLGDSEFYSPVFAEANPNDSSMIVRIGGDAWVGAPRDMDEDYIKIEFKSKPNLDIVDEILKFPERVNDVLKVIMYLMDGLYRVNSELERIDKKMKSLKKE